MAELKVFNLWETSGIKVEDPGLKRYISLRQIIVPKTHGRNVKTQFWKSKTHIVERLMGHLMVPGHKGKKHRLTSYKATGKAINKYLIVKRTFELIEKIMKK